MAALGQEEDRDQDAVGEKKIINRTFLSLSQITALSEQNVEGVQKKLEEFLNFKQLKTSLKEAIWLDYYTAGFWWAKERNFSVTQLSGFMNLLNFLLENLSDKHMTLGDNLKELGKAMAGIGETDSERSGDLNCFSIEQAKAVIDYLNIRYFVHEIIPSESQEFHTRDLVLHLTTTEVLTGQEYNRARRIFQQNGIVATKYMVVCSNCSTYCNLFKHYKLYEYLFHSPREELVISNENNTISSVKLVHVTAWIKELFKKYVIELAQPSVPPFPALLEDGIPSDIYSSFIISPTAAETESKGSDQEGYLEDPCPEVESFEADAVAGVTAEDQKSTVGEIPSEVIGNLEAEINEKLQMQKEAYTLRMEKLKSPK